MFVPVTNLLANIGKKDPAFTPTKLTVLPLSSST